MDYALQVPPPRSANEFHHTPQKAGEQSVLLFPRSSPPRRSSGALPLPRPPCNRGWKQGVGDRLSDAVEVGFGETDRRRSHIAQRLQCGMVGAEDQFKLSLNPARSRVH